MVAQRRRRWATIMPTLGQRLVFNAGKDIANLSKSLTSIMKDVICWRGSHPTNTKTPYNAKLMLDRRVRAIVTSQCGQPEQALRARGLMAESEI